MTSELVTHVGSECNGILPEDMYGLNDVGNSRRLIDASQGRFVYVKKWKKWYCWDGKRWTPDDAPVVECAKYVSTHMNPKGGDSKAISSHMRKSPNAGPIDQMIKLAKSSPSIAFDYEKFDREPFLLNVGNGTVDLNTGKLRPHDPKDYLTQITPVHFDPDATCPLFDMFLSHAMGGSKGMIRFIRKLIGNALTGSVKHQVLAFNHGCGSNGKSTFYNTISALMGEYASPAPDGLLMQHVHESHPTKVACLYKIRFCVSNEVDKDSKFDESMIKRLVSTDPLKTRRMNEDFWTFVPTHKLFVSGNHKPEVKGRDNGMWRRLKSIPWVVKIEDGKQDKELESKLLKELPGILNWAIAGWLDLCKDGMSPPEEVNVDTAQYRSESDSAMTFINDRCLRHADARITRKALRHQYLEWCEEQEKTQSQITNPTDFGALIRSLGVTDIKAREDGHVRDAWAGIRMKTDMELEGVATVARPQYTKDDYDNV